MVEPTPDALAARYDDPIRTSERIEVDGDRFERAPDDGAGGWGIGALVVDGGRTLFVREGDTWLLPGGRLECGESPETGAIREVEEETGIDVEVAGLGAVAEQTFVHEDSGETREFSFATFLAEPTTTATRPDAGTLDERIDEAAWLVEVPANTFDRDLVVRLLDERL